MRLSMASMLEGFVSQLLADYLSNYVQGIHPEQFRLGLWSGVAQLENVELRLEAFDYLQLPIAIKKGVVGKLKIQVPWKKLGREPILIALEDVYLCACPRDEFEWKSEALQARSLAAKKAKLAAAELAKLSARISGGISDDHSNQSFFSYLSTKILDNMQVIAKNLHFRYIDQKTDPEMAFSFGIKFSHLTMNTEHPLSGAGSGKVKANLVNKLVEVKEFSLYWNSNEDDGKNLLIEPNSSPIIAHSQDKWMYLIHPFDASLRFMVNKNTLLDGSTPQYSMTLEICDLDFTLEDRQLHEMLLLWDALSICQMREKYGRFRPAVGQNGFNRRESGWQKVWWHYAVQAVLVDVQRNLRRTSWTYLGWRIDMRRKYVVLYKEKLDCLWTGKPAADQSLCKLEELEKELDLDEILSFRSTAESSLQNQGIPKQLEEDKESEQISAKSEVKPDDLSSWKERSWLNFLSLGMLGAAGSTAASEQFAGVLPDEIIEDIFEATEYHPLGLKDHEKLPKGSCRCAITLCIGGISITLWHLHPKEAIASLELKIVDARIKVWQQSTKFLITVEALKVSDHCEKLSAYPVILGNEGTILPQVSMAGLDKQSYAEDVSGIRQSNCAALYNGLQSKQGFKGPFIVVEVEVLSENEEFDLIVKIAMQQAEFVYSPMLMKEMNSFLNRPTSLQTLKDLIFSSLDRLQSPQIRLQSKAELTLAMGKRISLLFEVQRPILIFPNSLQTLNSNHLIVMMNSLQVTSIDHKNDSCLKAKSGKLHHLPSLGMVEGLELSSQPFLECTEECNSEGNHFIHSALYDKFHLQLHGVQVIVAPYLFNWHNCWKGPNDLENFHIAKCFDAEAVLEICALLDEPTLTRFKLHGNLPPLQLTFSPEKWKMFKSLFSSLSEEKMAGHEGLHDSSVTETRDGSLDHGNLAPYFKMELISNTLSLLIHSDEDERLQHYAILFAKGESASLVFTDLNTQQELLFSVASVHVDEALRMHDYGPFLSVHSMSCLSMIGLFELTTVWKWKWQASQMIIALRGDDTVSKQQALVVCIEDMELMGSWKDDHIDSFNCKAVKVRTKVVNCSLDSDNVSLGCHLCATSHWCFVRALEQQYHHELLVCEPMEALFGLEVDVLAKEEDDCIIISMPLAKVNVHLSSWSVSLQILSLYLGGKDPNSQRNVSKRLDLDGQDMDKPAVLYPHRSALIVQTSVISVSVILPDFCETFSEVHASDIGNSCTSDRCSYSKLYQDATQRNRSISSSLTFQVENFCYRDAFCNLEASILKCEINLIDSILGSSQCLPLLQVADMQVKSDIDMKSFKRSVNLVGSCLVKRLDVWCSHSILQFLRSFRFEEGQQAASTFEFELIEITTCLQRGSILLTDGRWNYNAPIFELRVKSMDSQMNLSSSYQLKSTISILLEADYHDIKKVAWEPFLEPWNMLCDVSLRFAVNSRVQQMDLKFSSSRQLNINVTRAFLQASSRAVDLFADASHIVSDSHVSSKSKSFVGYAPYWLQNDTGVSIKYWLVGALRLEDADGLVGGGSTQNIVEPGSSLPIYIEETPEQVFHKGRLNASSERLSDKRFFGGQHRMIRVQLEGTSNASLPMSMDLVGAHTFYVTFSHPSNNVIDGKRRKEKSRTDAKSSDGGDSEGSKNAFQMPVVFEVSGHYYSKVMRIYSTVSLVNATSIPMEVRFDIPFGLLPKVMEPILPGEVIPLPIHLAETGQLRWRPMGNSHLWSETQSLSHILSASKPATLRSFVCYPSNPSNAIFRCCIMVQESMGPTIPISTAVSEHLYDSTTSSKNLNISSGLKYSMNEVPSSIYAYSSNPIVRELTFQAPFVFRNCLPLPLALVISSSAGLHLRVHVPEGDSIFVLEANTGHDLALTLNVPGFLPASAKLTSAIALLEHHREAPQNQITYAETLNLFPDSANGHTIHAKSESLFNLVSGAREFSIFVPFWFYNHSGVSLGFVDGDTDLLSKDQNQITEQVIPSFSMLGREEWSSVTKSFGLQTVLHESSRDSHRVYTHGQFCGTMARRSLGGGKTIVSCIPSKVRSSDSESSIQELQKPKPYIYSPVEDIESWDSRLRARVALSSSKGLVHTKESEVRWSRPFSLNPPGGMTTIVIPASEQEEGLILSVVSASVLGAAAGKTRTITFQPRFILANICNQDLCYRQQGTDTFRYLLKGKQAHLLWSDMSRPLLVSVRFDQHDWAWSGAFVPDQLGDTQLKIRNLATGVTHILRVEVQNAMSLENELNDIPSTDNSLGTYLILLSNDESGFMPYRIENFSLERLRFYQSKCTDFESTLLPYSSCLYAWDEPWLPHQLVLEIPGEGCVGTFDLDDVREYPTVHIPATNQKPERWFLICVHAEGPARVLSFQDLHLHPSKDCLGFTGEGLTQQTINEYTGCAFTFNFCFSSIGVSIIDTCPQEILFASARDLTLQLSQNPLEQKLSMSISYIQFDNQLPLAQYPVMLLAGVFPPIKSSVLARAEGMLEGASNSNAGLMEHLAFGFSVSKWRRLASSVDCFQKIDARFAPVQVQLDEHIISCLIDFFRTARDTGCHALYPNGNDPYRFSAGNSSRGCQRYKLILDPKSTHLHLLKILQYEPIYRCWPSSRAIKCLQVQNSDLFLLARGGRKIYIEALFIAPIEVIASFSSIPWTDRHRSATQPRNLLGETGPSVQRSLMALIDIEGASVQLRQLSLAHPLARWDAIGGMITRHYTRQLLHGIYKVLGSAGFLGNPLGFMKSLGSGVRDFVSAPAKSFVQSPKQLVGGFAEGTQSLVSNTVFAVSSAATLISRAARKGVTTFALGHQQEPGFQDYGVIGELLEGLTGLLQSPVTGAERHGLPGILSGVAVGAIGVVARPIASILEVAGRTAQSIRSWSQPIQQAKRMRPPRYLSRDSPLLPYSLEEAIGNAVLLEAADSRLQSEVYITCRPLLEAGRYAILTERYFLIVKNAPVTHSDRVGPQWIIDMDINLEDVLHVERNGEILSMLVSAARCPSRTRTLKKTQVSVYKKQPPISSPLLHESITLATIEDAEELLACMNYLLEEHKKSKTSFVRL